MESVILGAGVTGLAAGFVSGLPVYEANSFPGGICSSYYLVPGSSEKHNAPPPEPSYRFEHGGGHWIFGGDPAVLRFLRDLGTFKGYSRKSGVYFAADGRYVPYPLQNNLASLDTALGVQALTEMAAATGVPCATMEDWLSDRFGTSLVELFFGPFHDRYTAGLWKSIAPQDPYKSPVQVESAIQGLVGNAPSVGYNVTFLYPEQGLNGLAATLAGRCDVRYGKRLVAVDLEAHKLGFDDGSEVEYERVLSTLPLTLMQELSGLQSTEPADPYSSVLVLNIGGVKGARCPDDHWLYIPDSRTGFHRVGFYSNVDTSFVPDARDDRVSIYVESAYPSGEKPDEAEIARICKATVQELCELEFLSEAEVVDPTWIDVAYTWSWPGSRWKPEMLAQLEAQDIFMVGRYGRWIFQGIADSIRDGLMVGSALARGVGID